MKHFFTLIPFVLAACDNSPTITQQDPTQYSIVDSVRTIQSPSGREIEFRTLAPEDCEACPFVFFSHGANATFDRYDALLFPLALRGFHIVAPNHTDSEEHKTREKYSMSESLRYRLEDYELLLDHYQPEQHISAGHSYGAMIAQITAGAKLSPPLDAGVPKSKYSPEIVLAISPPGPIPNYMEAPGWQQVKSPSLIVTGTKDIVPTMTENWEDHLVSFSVAPKGSIAVIYEDMDHYMNGAYGRENQNVTPERTQAMEHLINVMVEFTTNPDKIVKPDPGYVEVRRR